MVFLKAFSGNLTRKRRAISLFSFASLLLLSSLASVVSSLGSTSTNEIPDTLKHFSDEKQIVEKIEKNVLCEVESIVQIVLSYYRKIIDEKRTLINSLVHASVEYPVFDDKDGKANVEEAANFTSKLNTDYKVVSKLVSELNNTTKSYKGLAEKINGTLTIMGINTCESNVLNIANLFETLKRFNSKPLPTLQWAAASLFQSIVDLLANSMETIQIDVHSTAEKLFKRLNETIYDVSNELYRSTLNQIQSLPIQQLSIELSGNYSKLHNLTLELNRSNSTEKSMQAIYENVRPLCTESNSFHMANWGFIMINREKQLNYLHALSVDKSSKFWSRDWTVAFKRPTELNLHSSKWYSFLADLYSKLGEYEFQHNLEQKLLPQNQNDFDKFLSKLRKFNISVAGPIKKMKISSTQFRELNQLMNLTLKSEKFRLECREQENLITITGDYVKLSDLVSFDTKRVRKDLCPRNSKFEFMNIFAINTMFIDCDLDAMNDLLNLTIMAPKWEMIGNRTMVLDGSVGGGGSFLGIGNQFVGTNVNHLTINGGMSREVKMFNLGNSTNALSILKERNSRFNQSSSSFHFANRIQEYKTFLWNQLNDDESYRFKGHLITQFLAQLNGNVQVYECAYDLLDWFGELDLLEQVPRTVKNRKILIRSYESLYRESFGWYNSSQRIPRSYVFSAASIQLFNLKKDFDKALAKVTIHYGYEDELFTTDEDEDEDLFVVLVQTVKYILPKLRKQHDLRNAYLIMDAFYAMILGDDHLLYGMEVEDDSKQVDFPSFNRTDFEDAQVFEALDKLDSKIRAFFVQQLYKTTVVTLKQLVFPYGHAYLDTYSQLTVKLITTNNSNDLEALINEAVNKIAKMLSQSTKNNYLKASIPQNYSRGHSNNSFEMHQNPFYVWTNEQHADTITRLLYGEAVTLKADVRESDPRKDAIKFDTIEFNLKAKNASKQIEIDQILNKCSFSAIQTGNSYYRYGGKYYSIRNAPMKLYKGTGKRMHLKMVGGSMIMLSPYATWKIQLADCDDNSTLPKLRALADDDEMDLVLAGQGSYVEAKDSGDDDDLHVEHYYREYLVNMNSTASVEAIDTDTAQQYDLYKMSKFSSSMG